MAREINPRLKNLARMTSNPDASVPDLEEKLDHVETDEVAELRGFIYVPSLKLYVAKEKSLFGKNWFEAHEELEKNGFGMLTPRQFFQFVFYLKDNEKKIREAGRILDDIFSRQKSWKAEWLDARFTREGLQLFFNYDHRIVNGSIIDYKKEPLLKCFMEDGYIDMTSVNRQGLPTVPGEDINYWYPREKSVTLFYTDPVWVYLSCFRSPETTDSYVGVRMTCKK